MQGFTAGLDKKPGLARRAFLRLHPVQERACSRKISGQLSRASSRPHKNARLIDRAFLCLLQALSADVSAAREGWFSAGLPG
jgi:hypothetical protein